MTQLLFDVLLLLGFLGASAILAGAEAAYFSLSRLGVELRDTDGSPSATRLTGLLKNPHDLLITILVGVTLANIASSALATGIVTEFFGPKRGVGIAIAGMVFLIVVFGKVLPMTIAVGSPLRFARFAAGPVELLRYVLTPIRKLLGGAMALFSQAVEREQLSQAAITEAELRTLLEMGHQEGVVERSEREMIHGVFELGETTVGDIMRPRTDVFGVDVATPPHRLLAELRTNLHHRVPVYEGSLDNIIGILSTKDLLAHYMGLPPGFDLRHLLAPPYFVPETKRADALLRELQTKRLRMAIVVDEYGGTAGLATIEDILEEVVGEIRDEFEAEERLVQPVDQRTYRVIAKLPIRDFNALTGLAIPDEHFDTVGGWVLDLFGRVPHRAETIDVDGIRVTVERVYRARILEVLVRLPEAPAPAKPAE